MAVGILIGIIIALVFIYVGLATTIVKLLYNRGRSTDLITWVTFYTGLTFDHTFQSRDGSIPSRVSLFFVRLFGLFWFSIILIYSNVVAKLQDLKRVVWIGMHIDILEYMKMSEVSY